MKVERASGSSPGRLAPTPGSSEVSAVSTPAASLTLGPDVAVTARRLVPCGPTAAHRQRGNSRGLRGPRPAG